MNQWVIEVPVLALNGDTLEVCVTTPHAGHVSYMWNHGRVSKSSKCVNCDDAGVVGKSEVGVHGGLGSSLMS